MRRRGLRASSRLLHAGLDRPEPRGSRRARTCRSGSRAVVVERLRLADDRPMAIERVVAPPSCAGILDDDLAGGSLHDAFERLGRIPTRAQARGLGPAGRPTSSGGCSDSTPTAWSSASGGRSTTRTASRSSTPRRCTPRSATSSRRCSSAATTRRSRDGRPATWGSTSAGRTSRWRSSSGPTPDGATTLLVASDTRPTHAERGPDGVAAVMVEAGLARDRGAWPDRHGRGRRPGSVRPRDRRHPAVPELPRAVDAATRCGPPEAGLGRPVVFINDARAHTLAEARMGAGRGARTMALVDARDGRRWRPDHRRQAAPGQRAPPANRSPDGRRRTVPCAAAATAAAPSRSPRPGAMTRGRRQGQGRGRLRGRDRRRRALPSRRSTRRSLPRRSRIGNVVTVLVPDRVVIGGGIARGGRPHPRAAARRGRGRTPVCCRPTRIDIVLAELGPLAGAIGAALAGAEAV